MQKICIHILIRDKFTQGYINFFNHYDFDWKHYFITFDGKYKLNTNQDNVFIAKNYFDIVFRFKKYLDTSDRIVVGSFFDEAISLLFMNRKNWEKTYIQFWGGDIYRFRVKNDNFVQRIKKMIIKKMIKKCILICNGVLTLVPGDYFILKELFEIKEKKHMVVQVPDDFYELNHINYELIKSKDFNDTHRVLIGNSSTIENNHIDIFYKLRKVLKDKIEIIVPLSYGDFNYREKVLSVGKDLFHDSFIPIIDYMEREDYIRLISSCDIAIFNNDRQQATGNIILLTNLEKKIYLRTDTTMWQFFVDNGFIFNDIKLIENYSERELFDININEILNNKNALKKMENRAINEWKEFYEQM